MSKPLFSWESETGKGACTAKCYNEVYPEVAKCHCACGGMNHRAGRLAAIRNTRVHAREWAAAIPGLISWDVAPIVYFRNEQWKQRMLT